MGQQNKNEGFRVLRPARPGQGGPRCHLPPIRQQRRSSHIHQLPSCPRWCRHCGPPRRPRPSCFSRCPSCCPSCPRCSCGSSRCTPRCPSCLPCCPPCRPCCPRCPCLSCPCPCPCCA